jgi:predicted type IV restriction endonuclease
LIAKQQGLQEMNRLVSRLLKTSYHGFNETDTMIGFFVPFLRALGWDMEDGITKETHFNGYADRSNVSKGLPDCVLYVNKKAYAAFELKPLSYGTIDRDRKMVQRVRDYRTYLGCRVAVITRVCETVIYDWQSERDLAIRSPNDIITQFDGLWNLLSKESASQYASLHESKPAAN